MAALPRPLTGDVVVSLAGGTYQVSQPLVFDAADSGDSSSAMIRWQAANPADPPVISGGTSVSGWNVYDASKNIYVASVPVGTKSRQLFVNGQRAARAWVSKSALGTWTSTSTGYTVTDPNGLLGAVTTARDLELVYPSAGSSSPWTASRCDVASISGTTITMVQPCWTNARLAYPNVGSPTSVENSAAFLDVPGEWYLDSAAGQVYYIPRSGESLSSAPAVLAVSDKLLSASNLAYVSFTNINFEYATWMGPSGAEGVVDLQANLLTIGAAHKTYQLPGVVAFHASHDIDFESNTVAHVGAGGLTFDQGSANNIVRGNVIYDTSGSGVTLGSGTYNPTSPNSYVGPSSVEDGDTIVDNYVHDVSVEFPGGAGIAAFWVKNTTIAHNEVARVPYTGITLGWGWGNTNDAPTLVNNHVDYNYVHDVISSSLNDGGAIYLNGANAAGVAGATTSSVTGNYIDGDPRAFGSIYMDNGTSYFSVTNNYVNNGPAGYGVFITSYAWGGSRTQAHYNVVQNNALSPNTLGLNTGYPADNTVSNNTINVAATSPTAKAIIAAAGLEAAYQNLDPKPDINLALLGTATASSSYSSNYVASKAIDSHSDTLWSSTSADHAAWWQLDLNTPQTIDSLSLLARQDGDYGGSDRQNFKVQAANSPDLSDAVTLCTIGASAYPHASTITCPGSTTPYRYLRISKTDTAALTFAEVRVYGPAPVDTNLALGRAATAVSQWSASYPASKAVDGNASTLYVSQNGAGQRWQVALDQPSTLTQIQLVFRSDGYNYATERQNFEIRVSNSPDLTTGYTVACAQGSTALPYASTYTCVPPAGSWQYVGVAKTDANAIVLAEVRVYGH